MKFKEKWKNVDEIILQELVNQGLSTKKIAELYNMSYWSIYKKLKDYSINIPKYYHTKNKSPKIYKVCKYCKKLYLNNKYGEYCSKICLDFANNCYDDLSDINDLEKEIIKLHQSGLPYSEISKILNCSKSIIGYYCNPKYRKNQRDYAKERKKQEGKIQKHVNSFNRNRKNIGRPVMCKNWKKKLRRAIDNWNDMDYKLKIKDVIDKFGTKTICYLTGVPIDLEKDDYCFDHIMPKSKGGNSSIDNLGITIPKANYSKCDLTLEEYLDLCKQVLEHNGYIVTKQ